jgi:hypothetical protein
MLVLLTACPAVAQYGTPYTAAGTRYAAPKQYSDIIPSVAPDPGEGAVVAEPAFLPDPTMPPGRPPAAVSSAEDRLASPVRSIAADDPTPFSTLTGQRMMAPLPTQFGAPLGSYPGPGYNDNPNCCGPVGRNGPIGYELYLDTGPSFAFGAGDFAHRLETGWMVNGGGRTFLFNPARDAAWSIDLGLSFQYNRGNQVSPTFLDVRQPNTTDAAGQVIHVPDVLTKLYIRDLDRTNFNFGIGRDWWLWGPGATGAEDDWNVRVGGLVGGRWGTAHVNEVPTADPFGYFRRQDVTHGFFVELHANFEVPMGSVIWFGGLKVQYGYDWTNIAPPFAGDIQSINLLLSTGFRF